MSEPESALAERVQAFARAFERASFSIAITRGVDPFDVLYVNPAFEDFIGMRLDELLGRNLRLLQGSHREQPEARRVLREALKAGECCQVLLRNFRKDGQRFDNQLTVLPIYGDGPSPELFLGLQRDVTEEIRGAEELKQSWSLLADAEKIARCGTWQWKTHDQSLRWSPGIFEIVGQPPWSGPMPFDRQGDIYPEDFQKLCSAVERCVEEGVPYGLDLRLRRLTGEEVWTHARGRRIIDPSTGEVSLVGTLQEIQERKAYEAILLENARALAEARDRAEAADRAKSAFLAAMSHEIRTPMNGVLGAASLLRLRIEDPQSRELVHTIESSGAALVRIIDDILDHSKIEAGQLEVERAWLDFEDVVEEAVRLFAGPAAAKSIGLEMEVLEPLKPLAEGDAGRIKQILANLIGNAVKFTERGQVTVTLRQVGPHRLEVAVRDTGIGMSKEGLDRLFRPFIQEDASMARRFGGTGLGLSISQRLARLMGGDLSVESEQGAGSCFTLELPFSRLWPRAPDARLAGIRVALDVEEPRAKARLARILEQAGAMLAPSGAGADLRVSLLGEAVGGAVEIWALSASSRTDSAAGRVRLPSPVRRPALIEACQTMVRQGGEEGSMERPGLTLPRAPFRVLVVDDNAVNRWLAGELLSALGVECDLVESGAEAIEAVRQRPYEVVLMDIQMPEMDGFEATRRIREGAGSAPRIVALTANAFAEDRERALSSGMNAFLAKPIQLEDLSRLLSEVLTSKPQPPP